MLCRPGLLRSPLITVVSDVISGDFLSVKYLNLHDYCPSTRRVWTWPHHIIRLKLVFSAALYSFRCALL